MWRLSLSRLSQLSRFSRLYYVLLALLVLIVCSAALPPKLFPINEAVIVNSGASLREISENLANAEVIKSPVLFRAFVRLVGTESKLQAGDYWFEARLPAWTIVSRLVKGRFVAEPIKITIPEGLNAKQLSRLLGEKLPHLGEAENLAEIAEIIDARLAELMPDTYFWPPEIGVEKALELMRANFARQTRDLRPAAVLRGRAWADILVLASLVEEEASDPTDRRLIAGLLWKRLDSGMRLQVDVAPETYEQSGLPARAIANISLDALEAVVYPEASDFWYYISDADGVTHYAETFEQHKQNIAKYL